MKQYEIDSFDIEDIISLIANFCHANQITEVNVRWFSLDIDDDVEEVVAIADLGKKMIELYDKSEGNVLIYSQYVDIDWDTATVFIKYDEEHEHLVQAFLDYEF